MHEMIYVVKGRQRALGEDCFVRLRRAIQNNRSNGGATRWN
jgi:hypothetical protein